MKNNIIPLKKYEQEINNSPQKSNINNKTTINNLNQNDIQSMKISLNKLRNICNILKEKNTIIDGMLLSTKKRKKILSEETSEKENELIQLENEINIYYNKLFSEYIHTDNKKNQILSKLKLIKEELTQRKYIDYLNKKIMIEQKEEKIQQKLNLLSTERLELFNQDLINNNNGNDLNNYELIKKQYEDIKKSDIYNQIFNEIKESLYNEKYNNIKSMSSLDNKNNGNNSSYNYKSKKKFNSKMLSSSNYFQPYSVRYSEMKNNMFSNKKKKGRNNYSMDNNRFNMDNEDLNATQKYLMENNKFTTKSFIENIFKVLFLI